MQADVKQVIRSGMDRFSNIADTMKTAREFAKAGEFVFGQFSELAPEVPEMRDTYESFQRLRLAFDDMRAKMTRVIDRMELEFAEDPSK